MDNTVLDIVIEIRKTLLSAKHDNGELSGNIELTTQILSKLALLVEEGIIEDLIYIDGESYYLSKIQNIERKDRISITLYTRN